MDASNLKKKKEDGEAIQVEKQGKELLEGLEGQINSCSGNLDSAVKAAFAPNFEVRAPQVALIMLVEQQNEKIVVAEWPCAAGKSSVLAIRGNFLCSQQVKPKVIISVPNKLLALLMTLDCQ
jgi:hypothetical protein